MAAKQALIEDEACEALEFFDPTWVLNLREQALLTRMLSRTKADVTSIERQSEQEFDFVLRGHRASQTEGFTYRFTAWFPLYCIHELPWTEERIAGRTDYPGMVRKGDWSGVRDTKRKRIWKIFRRFVLKEKGD